jgi:hypothetical protein
MKLSDFLLKRKNIIPALGVSLLFSLVWVWVVVFLIPNLSGEWETVSTEECPVTVQVRDNGSPYLTATCDDETINIISSSQVARALYDNTDTAQCTISRHSHSGDTNYSCRISS